MKLRHFLMALTFLSVPASLVAQGAMVATSQTRIEKHGPGPARDVQQSDATMREMVRCVVDRSYSKVSYLLDTVPGSLDEERTLGSFQSRMDWCTPENGHGGIAFPWAILRGAFAEELLRHDFAGGVSPREAGFTPISEMDATRDKVRVMMTETARCVVTAAPAQVDRLVRSAPFSQDENTAFAVITPFLPPCLDSTVKATISRQSLRAYLADSLYSYAVAGRIGNVAIGERK